MNVFNLIQYIIEKRFSCYKFVMCILNVLYIQLSDSEECSQRLYTLCFILTVPGFMVYLGV